MGGCRPYQWLAPSILTIGLTSQNRRICWHLAYGQLVQHATLSSPTCTAGLADQNGGSLEVEYWNVQSELWRMLSWESKGTPLKNGLLITIIPLNSHDITMFLFKHFWGVTFFPSRCQDRFLKKMATLINHGFQCSHPPTMATNNNVQTSSSKGLDSVLLVPAFWSWFFSPSFLFGGNKKS